MRPLASLVTEEHFLYVFKPALAGRGAALQARSALPLRSRPARPGSAGTRTG